MLLRNYEALDFLEGQAGRVAFKLPEPDITLERELVAVSHLIREVGEALQSVAETLADGIVEEGELRTTIPKLEAVIQECASLKYLLEDLSKKSMPPTLSRPLQPPFYKAPCANAIQFLAQRIDPLGATVIFVDLRRC